jgi:hypothetical protein
METPENYIFVFGSNRAGRHGKGAALFAREHFGAEYGVGEGLQGRSYAIPTKDENLRPLPLREIRSHYRKFVDFAENNPDKFFVLTPIGTGLAGHSIEDITAMVNDHLHTHNVVLHGSWAEGWQNWWNDVQLNLGAQ